MSQFIANDNPVSDLQFHKSVVYGALLSCCVVALNTSKTPITEAPNEQETGVAGEDTGETRGISKYFKDMFYYSKPPPLTSLTDYNTAHAIAIRAS